MPKPTTLPDAEREFSETLIAEGVFENDRIARFHELWNCGEHLAHALKCLDRTIETSTTGRKLWTAEDLLEVICEQLTDRLQMDAGAVVEQMALQHLRMSDPIARNRAALRARRQTSGREIDAAVRIMPTAALEAAVG